MHHISHIIATTDFSTAAERAVQRAALIAQQLGAKLHLLHVVHPLDMYPGPELSFDAQLYYREQILQEVNKNQTETLAASLRVQYGIPVKAITRIGRAHTEIACYAASHAGSLIVAGARGENTLLDLLLGSTATRLLHVADCPVLIVKNREAASYKQVIAAVDFSSGSADVPALARTVAPNADIEVLHIFDAKLEAHRNKAGMSEALQQKQRDSAQAQMEKQMDAILAESISAAPVASARMTGQILVGYPSASICERAKVLQADLIVIGRHSKSGLEDWLLGSVSKGVISAAKCDALLLKPLRETQGQ
ncbi:MAG: universal stress protein [Methylophilaceae bacterium]|nr:universal stress protein [Methylophilaceae bacterium]